VLASPSLAGARPRELAKGSARAIAVDDGVLYFGDTTDDGLYAVPKSGGESTKLARRSPMPAGLAVDRGMIAWIASPGDVVLRTSLSGDASAPTAIREHGLFTGIAIAGGDVFVVEAEGSSSIVTRTSGSATSKIASFEGSPRGLTLDDAQVYVATSTRLVATPRGRGEPATLATGSGFAHPATGPAERFVYATIPMSSSTGHARSIVRVPKTGGPLEVVATEARDAPIAVRRGSVYWFDAIRPAVLAASEPGPPRTIAEDDALAQPAAIAVDDNGVFVATGFAEEGRILQISLIPGQ
jgi:hypothetical protein